MGTDDVVDKYNYGIKYNERKRVLAMKIQDDAETGRRMVRHARDRTFVENLLTNMHNIRRDIDQEPINVNDGRTL